MYITLLKYFLYFIIAFFNFTTPLYADERIKSFHSEITVLENGVVDIIETIKVKAERKQIKHGIYRDVQHTRFSNVTSNVFRKSLVSLLFNIPNFN